MNAYKARFATDRPARTLAEAIDGADVFLGVSVAGVVTKEMVLSMADAPIVFALANPDPEISYPAARAARSDVLMATGRSRLPQPGQQRARLPVHLPRRARCASTDDR